MPLAITRWESFAQSPAAIRDQAVRRSQSRNATGTAALLGLLAIGGLFAFLDLEAEPATLMSPLALAVICMAVGLVPAAVAAITRPRFDIFEPIHLIIAAFTLITAVRALYLIGYGTAVYPRVPSEALLSAALALSIAGMLSVYTGYYSGIGYNLVASMRPWKPLWVGEIGYRPAIMPSAAASGLPS